MLLFSNQQTGECLKEKIDKNYFSSTTIKSKFNKTASAAGLSATTQNVVTTSEHNPYSNYSGEYGKEFNHYVRMGMNESDVQESIDKIVDMEVKFAHDELRRRGFLQDADGYVVVDVAENEIRDLEPLKHPQYVSDHHTVSQHEETIAMVTVGCLILGMLVFLLAMVFIRRIIRKVPSHHGHLDLEADWKKTLEPNKMSPTKIIHEALPSRKHFEIFIKSTFSH